MLTAEAMQGFRDRGLHPAASAGVSVKAVQCAEARRGVMLPRFHGGSALRVDHREAVQDMKPLDAVEYLLGVIEAVIEPPAADLDWTWFGMRLQPHLKRVLRILVAADGKSVPRGMLYRAIQTDHVRAAEVDCNGARGKGRVVDVYVCRLRKVVADRGVRIKTTYGAGWAVFAPPGFVWPWEVRT